MYGRTLDFSFEEQFEEDCDARMHSGDLVAGSICVIRIAVQNAQFFGIEYGCIIEEVSPQLAIVTRTHSTKQQWYFPDLTLRGDGTLMSRRLAEQPAKESKLNRYRTVISPYIPEKPSRPFGYILGQEWASAPIYEEINVELRAAREQ